IPYSPLQLILLLTKETFIHLTERTVAIKIYFSILLKLLKPTRNVCPFERGGGCRKHKTPGSGSPGVSCGLCSSPVGYCQPCKQRAVQNRKPHPFTAVHSGRA